MSPNFGGVQLVPFTVLPPGTVAPVIPEAHCRAINLARYAHIIGYPECAFFGIEHPDAQRYECRSLWSQIQREDIDYYLAEAQDEIENVINYPVVPTYIVGEEKKYYGSMTLRWGNLLEVGVEAFATIGLAVPLNQTNDPAVATIATTLTNTAGINVYHPGTNEEMFPLSMGITGGVLTVILPRARTVLYSKMDNPPEGLDYNDSSNFETSVDIYYSYTDPSDQATIVSLKRCNNPPCDNIEESGCVKIRRQDISSVEVVPATFTNGIWKLSRTCKGEPYRVYLNYLAGNVTITRQLENAIVRLAHSKMPTEPCGCEVTQRLWQRDRHIPDILTKERLNCDFGMSDGAWTAWRFAGSVALRRAGINA